MNEREALKLALEALEQSRVFVTTREKIKHPEGTEWYDERINALRERLAQPAPDAGWQPIETAPKTGCKVILFYLNLNNLPRTVMARWLTDEQAAETDADDVGLEGGWYECIDNWDDYTEVAIHEGEPTHWMPLPVPPDEAAHGIERAHGIGGEE